MSSIDITSALRALSTPRRLAHSARHLSQGALSNAGHALTEIHRVVLDRADLTERLLEPRPQPGDLTLISERECWELLATQVMGRLAYIARSGVPDITPVNYAMDGSDVVIRSSAGPKLQAAERRDRVAFEVDAMDPGRHGGWSVVVHGRAELVRPDEPVVRHPHPWAAGPRRQVLRIRPLRVTGRRVIGLEPESMA